MKRMLWLTSALLLAAACFSARPTRAAVFERDWKTPGDGLLTYDDVNQREWLDLTQTLISQFAGVSFEERYQNAVAQTGSGGMFEGFAPADSEGAIALAHSAGIDTTIEDFAINAAAAGNLIDLLGRTLETSNDNFYSGGFLNDYFLPPYSGRMVSLFTYHAPAPTFGFAGMRFIGVSDDIVARSRVGLMLYREVPEQLSVASLLIGVALANSRHFLRRRPIR